MEPLHRALVGDLSLSTAMSAIPQFTDEPVRSGRTVRGGRDRDAEGSSILDLWWKSGSTTGGAARPAPPT